MGYLRGWLCNFERLLVLELPLASRYKDTTLDLSFPAFIFINIIDQAVDGLKELEMCDLIAALSIYIYDCVTLKSLGQPPRHPSVVAKSTNRQYSLLRNGHSPSQKEPGFRKDYLPENQ